MPKRHFLLAIPLVCALLDSFCTSPAQAQSSVTKLAPDTLLEPLPQATRSHNFDLKHVKLELNFNIQARFLKGTATLKLALFKPSNRVLLDAAHLQIAKITDSAGRELQYLYNGSADDDALQIQLANVQAAGQDFEIRVQYQTTSVNQSDPNSLGGSLGQGIRFFAPSTTEPRKRLQVWVNGEPDGNRYWFPSYDAPNDLHSTELIAELPKPLSFIGIGELLSVQDIKAKDGQALRRFHWYQKVPHANHRVGFVVGEYANYQQKAGELTINNFGYPDEVQATKASLSKMPHMVQFFTDYIGAPYPYQSYNQVVVQDLPWGIALAGLATHTENWIDDAPTHAEYRFLWDHLSSETLAAQWFGGLLTPRSWRDVWLHRGLAHYMEALYDEKTNGRDELLLWFRAGDHSNVQGDWSNGIRTPVATATYDNVRDFVLGNSPYFRATLVLQMLHKHLGDALFQRAIQHFVRKHAHGLVSTEDFCDAIEEATGQNLQWFFQQWIYQTGQPSFTVSYQYDAANKSIALDISQENNDAADKTSNKGTAAQPNYPQTRLFKGDVEIEVDGVVHKFWLAAKAQQTLHIPSTSKPAFVNFDYQNTWIKSISFEKTSEELLAQLRKSGDVTARLSAMSELVNRAKEQNATSDFKIQIERALMAVATESSSKTYWRMRSLALSQLTGWLGPITQKSPAHLQAQTIAELKHLIATEQMWVKAQAITLLGSTRLPEHAELFIAQLNDPYDRVVNAAAIALGRSRSDQAFAALLALPKRPSWKNQSLISALTGLRELADPRAADLALHAITSRQEPRWTLATPVWDYRLAGAETLAAIGQSKLALPTIKKRFAAALAEDDINDVFSNLLLLSTLKLAEGADFLPALRAKYSSDPNAMQAIENYQAQFAEFAKVKPNGP